MITLDRVKPISRSVDSIVQLTRASIDELINIEDKLSSGKNHQYTYDQALKRLVEGTRQIHGKESISEESAIILLERGLKKFSESSEDEDKWEFTRDLRNA